MSAESAKQGLTIKFKLPVEAPQATDSMLATFNEQALLESQFYDKTEKVDWKAEADKQAHIQNGELHELRKVHAERLFCIIIIWLISDFFLVILTGYGRWPFPIPSFLNLVALKFSLDSKVLIALLVTTTATVLGLYVIAARWLFNGNSTTAKDKLTVKSKSKKNNSD